MFNSNTVLALLLLPAHLTSAQTACVKGAGYDFHFKGECNLENFRSAFEDAVFNNALRAPTGCTNTVDEELTALFGLSSANGLEDAVKEVCKAAQEAKPFHQLSDVPYERDGAKFVERYYDGGTHWNEETETLLYPSDGGTPEQVLRTDAARVKTYYEFAQDEPFVWPDLPQFDLDKCALKSAMCCWPQDRQANDNNGNCAKPYDENCVDRDPGDNTDLCSADLSYSPDNSFISANGFTRYRHNHEGPIHCHGFAWANDDMDTISRYKANNLFYVSMYDHMHQRGYVRKIPGTPMCGCQEFMPIASRSDCTQVDVTERYRFEKTIDGWTGEIEQADLDFNACQADGGNNDLEDYYQRLVDEGKVTTEQQTEFKKYIVGDNNCDDVFPTLMDNKGLAHGSSAEGIVKFDEGRWTFIMGEGKLAQPEKQKLNGLEVTEIIRQSRFPIIKRVCPSCDGTHATIYYRRLTDIPDDLDILDLVMNNWFDTYANTFNEDFALYSTYEDAVLDNEVNRWTFCNFNDAGVGFPRDCGPTGRKHNNWNSYYRGGGRANDHAFYVLTNPDFDDSEIQNIAVGKTIYQSSTGWGGLAERALDDSTVGIYGWGTVTHTNWGVGAWWSVWLGTEATVNMVYVWNRIDCCRDRIGGVRVELLDGINGGEVVDFKDFPATVVWNSLPMYAFDFEGQVGQTIRLRHTSGSNKVIGVAEVIVTGDIDESSVLRNIAVGKPSTQSSTCYGGVASRANDGSIASSWHYGSVAHTCFNKPETWWEVDLEQESEVGEIHVTNRYDCCWDRMNDFIIEVFDFKDELIYTYNHSGGVERGGTTIIPMPVNTRAQKIKISLEGYGRVLNFAELQVFGKSHFTPSSSKSLLFNPSASTTSLTFAGSVLHLSKISAGKPTNQSTVCDGGDPSLATDGKFLTVASTCPDDADPWWMLDLEQTFNIEEIVITRAHYCELDDMANFTVEVSESGGTHEHYYHPASVECGGTVFIDLPSNVIGDHIFMNVSSGHTLELAEVEVFGKEATVSSILLQSSAEINDLCNIGLLKNATMSQCLPTDNDNIAEKATDGDDATFAKVCSKGAKPYLSVDLEKVRFVEAVRFETEDVLGCDELENFTVEVIDDISDPTTPTATASLTRTRNDTETTLVTSIDANGNKVKITWDELVTLTQTISMCIKRLEIFAADCYLPA